MTSREQVTPQSGIPGIVLPEVGVPDNLPFSGGFSKNELLDTRTITMEQISEMLRNDGQARALYRVLSLPLRTIDPVFKPSEVDGSDGEEEASFVTEALTKAPQFGGMTTPFHKVLAFFARGMVDGYTVLEKVWQITEGGSLTYRKFAHRAARTVRFLLDESGGLEGVRQQTYWQGNRVDVEIPAEKLLVWTCQHEENPWYGESLFVPAYYHHDKKHKLYYIAHLAHQFAAIPARIGRVPSSATSGDIAAFRSNLAKMGLNTSMTIPEGYEVDPFGPSGAIPKFEELINHHDAMMAKSVLAHFLQLGTGSNVGSWALSQDQTDFFTMALEMILKEWADTWTFYAIPQLVDANFQSRAYPELVLGPLADTTRQLMEEIFKEIASAQAVNVTPEFLFKIEEKVGTEMGLDIDYEALWEQRQQEIEEERERARVVAAATAAAVADGALNSPVEDESGGSEAPLSEWERVLALADDISASMAR